MDGRSFGQAMADGVKALFILGVLVGIATTGIITAIVLAVCHWLV